MKKNGTYRNVESKGYQKPKGADVIDFSADYRNYKKQKEGKKDLPTGILPTSQLANTYE